MPGRPRGSAYLDLQTDEDDAMATIVGASISYRLAFGPNAGRKALTLQTLPTSNAEDQRSLVSKQSGFSLHAGVSCKAKQRKKLERMRLGVPVVTSPAPRSQSSDSQSPVTAISSMPTGRPPKTPYDDGPTGTPSHISCSARSNSSADWRHWCPNPE